MNDFNPNTRITAADNEEYGKFKNFPNSFENIENNLTRRSREMGKAESKYQINQSQEMGISGLESNTFVAGMPQPNMPEMMEGASFENLLNQSRGNF